MKKAVNQVRRSPWESQTAHRRRVMYYEYVGNLHVHSTYSDGSGTIAEIAQAGNKAGIDFIGINDHHTLQGLRDGHEGWHDRCLVLIGTEINEMHNHFLAYDIYEELPIDEEHPQRVIDVCNRLGGFGFLAHPFEKGSPMRTYGGHAYTWEDWTVTNFTGICLWNFTSQWKETLFSLPRALHKVFVDKIYGVTGPDEQILAKWDELLKTQKVVGIGGTDAHAFIISKGPWQTVVFPYEFLFRTINTHILTPEPFAHDLSHDKKLVYDALREGRCFIGFDIIGSTKGFRFSAQSGETTAIMGQDLPWSGDGELLISLPGAAEWRLLKDGKPVLEGKETDRTYKLECPGVYRLEAYRSYRGRKTGWIFSNPIYVKKCSY